MTGSIGQTPQHMQVGQSIGLPSAALRPKGLAAYDVLRSQDRATGVLTAKAVARPDLSKVTSQDLSQLRGTLKILDKMYQTQKMNSMLPGFLYDFMNGSAIKARKQETILHFLTKHAETAQISQQVKGAGQKMDSSQLVQTMQKSDIATMEKMVASKAKSPSVGKGFSWASQGQRLFGAVLSQVGLNKATGLLEARKIVKSDAFEKIGEHIASMKVASRDRSSAGIAKQANSLLAAKALYSPFKHADAVNPEARAKQAKALVKDFVKATKDPAFMKLDSRDQNIRDLVKRGKLSAENVPTVIDNLVRILSADMMRTKYAGDPGKDSVAQLEAGIHALGGDEMLHAVYTKINHDTPGLLEDYRRQ